MAPSSTVVAEYAKSGRSSCKGCSSAIAAGALRLGSSTNDPRGFDLVKWYHPSCLPAGSRTFATADEIKGFDSLMDRDRDALKKMETDESDGQTGNEVRKRVGGSIEKLGGKGSKHKKVDSLDGKESKTNPEECSTNQEPSADLKESGSIIDFSISDVKDTYKDAALPPKWKAFKTVIFRETEEGLHDSSKIAAFDFDGCLANTSVKRTGANAWSLMYPSIPEKLQELYKQGYKLVIFTNESNIERWKNKRQQAVDSKTGRLDNFIKLVDTPMQAFIACGMDKNKDQSEDMFRKPKIGLWRLLEQNFNSGIVIDMDQSFYVGDAAGRINDHSDADIKFAKTIGLKFYVPEEFFTS